MTHTMAYMMSRFPKLTETFILYEMLALTKLGVQVEVYPLLRQNEAVQHAEAESFVQAAHFVKPLSWPVVKAQFYWLFTRPWAYLKTWAQVLAGNATSLKFLSRAIIAMLLATVFARDMQQRQIEHIHAHWASHATLAAWIVHQLTGISYSFTGHAHDIYVERAMLDTKLRDAAFAVTISEHNKRFLHGLYGAELGQKVQVIHCGVDTAVFDAAERIPATPFTIACVGRLEEKKGQTYLIEACALLKKKGIPFRCLFVGEGDDRPQLEALIADRDLQDEVVLLGQQPRDKVRDILLSASAMVLPSVRLANGKQEGIPVAIMEALAMKLPTIATEISGIPELIIHEETGLLVPERDPAALAEAMARLAQAPELGEKLAAHGRAKVLAEFDLNRNAQLLYHEFLKVMTSPPASPAGATNPIELKGETSS